MIFHFLAGFGSILLAMAPGIFIMLLSMRIRDISERGKHCISFVALSVNLITLMGFLSFLYVRPTYHSLNMLQSLPFLTRFIFNPWIFHTFIIAGLLIIGILHRGFRRSLRDKHGFSIVTIAVLLVTMCMWVLGSIFHYGVAGKMFVGGNLSSTRLIPLHALLIFFLFYIAMVGLYVRYIRKRRGLWIVSVFVLMCGLVAYFFMSGICPPFLCNKYGTVHFFSYGRF